MALGGVLASRDGAVQGGGLMTERSWTSSIADKEGRHLPVFMICLYFQSELQGKRLKMPLKNEGRDSC